MPAFGVTSRPLPATVSCPFGFSNQASWPPYQIAVQSPDRPATTKLWPVTALSPQSFAWVVPTPPGSRFVPESSGSETSGELSLGAVCR